MTNAHAGYSPLAGASPMPEYTSPLLAISPGPTRVVFSSACSLWEGFLLEKHVTSPGERESASIERNVISMLIGQPSRFDYAGKHGTREHCVSRPGTITITPSGPVPDLRLHNRSEMIHCALETRFTRGVALEMNRASDLGGFRPGLQDEAIRRLLDLLVKELQAERPSGRIYVDSLAHALATRYVLLDGPSSERPVSRVCGLPARVLNRVREKIESNLETDLTLQSLAEESGYSRAHFLRMFRAAAGVTPHQYIVNLRLSRAQDYLRRKGTSIIDIAATCGFSSQSHMTTLFRRHLEMTPAEFRRNARAECVS